MRKTYEYKPMVCWAWLHHAMGTPRRGKHSTHLYLLTHTHARLRAHAHVHTHKHATYTQHTRARTHAHDKQIHWNLCTHLNCS